MRPPLRRCCRLTFTQSCSRCRSLRIARKPCAWSANGVDCSHKSVTHPEVTMQIPAPSDSLIRSLANSSVDIASALPTEADYPSLVFIGGAINGFEDETFYLKADSNPVTVAGAYARLLDAAWPASHYAITVVLIAMDGEMLNEFARGTEFDTEL